MAYSHNHRDANEPELLKVAEQLGAQWVQAPPLDGWILWRGAWFPVEIKMPERIGLEHEYTPAQRKFLARCVAIGAKWLIWRTQDDVIRDLGGKRTA